MTPVIAPAFVRVTDDPLGIQRHTSIEAADWRASYSARNGEAGLTYVARRDGIYAAASAASDWSAITLAMVGRSAGCTPKSRAEIESAGSDREGQAYGDARHHQLRKVLC